MKEQKIGPNRNCDTRVRLSQTRRTQLTEAGLPPFALRLIDRPPVKWGHTTMFVKRHD